MTHFTVGYILTSVRTYIRQSYVTWLQKLTRKVPKEVIQPEQQEELVRHNRINLDSSRLTHRE